MHTAAAAADAPDSPVCYFMSMAVQIQSIQIGLSVSPGIAVSNQLLHQPLTCCIRKSLAC